MFSRRLVLWAIAVLCVSAALAGAGLLTRIRLSEPVALSPQEALQRLDSERAVALIGRVSAAPIYNIAANTSVRHHAEMLRRSSPLNGVPLFGPDGVPQDKWDKLVGSYVAAESRADGDPFLIHLKFQSPALGGEIIRQHIFFPLKGGNLWTISRGRAIIGGFCVFQEDVPGSSGFPRRFTDDEREWLQGSVFKGHLLRLQDYKADQLNFSEIKRLYRSTGARRADGLDQGWLIVQPSGEGPALSGSGWHMYVPFENTGGQVWAQLPLGTDLSRLPSEIRGIWLPPGSHAFQPDAARRVALVLAHPGAVQNFLTDGWLRHWSGIALIGAATLALAGLLLLALGLTARANPVLRAAVPAVAVSAAVIALVALLDQRPDDSLRAIVTGVAAWAPILVIWAMVIWYRRKRCRDAGLLKYRQWRFAWPWVSEVRRREVAKGLGDRALFWAHFLPEHRADAKSIVREELLARGYSDRDIASWTPAPSEVTVPPAVEKSLSLAQYQRLVNRRQWCLRVYVGLALVIAILVVMLGLGAAAGQPVDFKPAVGMLGLILMGAAALFSFLFRNRALRVLLLRPFGEKRMTRSLKRFVCKNVGRSGTVFTLSDRNFKPSILVTLLWRMSSEGLATITMFVLGPFLRASKRVASVKRERKFRKLQRHLLRKASPSYWSFLNGNQAFNVRSSDSWWQMCIHMLMHSSEIIVVDLSKVKEGTAWELEQLNAKNLLSKCLFIVGEKDMEMLAPVLQQYFPMNPPTVYVYRANGVLKDKRAFDAHFDRVAGLGLALWSKPPATVAVVDRDLVPA